MANTGLPEQEISLIKAQAARRLEMRREFLKQSTNPFKHAAEAGYVFDPAVQRYLSMKVSQLEFFKANTRSSMFGICAIILPMFAYGWLLNNDRTKKEEAYRTGKILYKDRLFKLA